MNIPDETFWMILVSVATAAAILAYRHPRQYRYFVMVHLGAAVFMLCIGFVGYTIGFVRGRDELVVAWLRDDRVMADHHVVTPDGLPLFATLVIAWGLLLLLTLLPRFGFVSKDRRE